jgi:two-component system response regulator (stage 0 sporulation protein F)
LRRGNDDFTLPGADLRANAQGTPIATSSRSQLSLHEDESMPSERTSGAGAAVKGRRVVVVDDDVEVRRLLVDVLTKDGHSVTDLVDGDQLLRLLDQTDPRRPAFLPPDLIVMDVRMPGLSGLDVLAALRSSRSVAPVILITAFGDGRTHETAHRLGAAAIFDKPFELDDLRRAVERVLAGS